MKLKRMTTKQFIESVEELGLSAIQNETYGTRYIDIKDKWGEIIAYVDVGTQGKMNIRKVTEGYDHTLLFKVMCSYASTPIDKRKSNTYKLKILDTNLYLVYINEYETTATTNSKAAKVYDSTGTYNAKVFAEKQGFTLRAEVINVDD